MAGAAFPASFSYSGDVVWCETFDAMTNVQENANINWADFMDKLPFDVPGWTGSNIRHPKDCGGAIQIGTSSSNGAGALLSPPIPAASGMSLVVEGRPKLPTATMPVCIVQDDATNWIADVSFGSSLNTAKIDLPALSAECRLLFCSPTNVTSDRRVRLDSVTVMSNCVAVVCTNEAAAPETIAFTGPRNCVYENDWNWLGGDGGVFADGVAGCGLRVAKSKSEWDGKYYSVTNGYKYSKGGFYSAAMEDEGDRAFVMRATGDDACVLSVAIANRGMAAVKAFEISYLGVQTFDGATNSTPRRLEAAWCATSGKWPDLLASDGWTAVPELDFTELSSVKAGPVFLTKEVRGAIAPSRKIEPGEVFSFRLKLAKGANSPALGIDNLRIDAHFMKAPTLVVFR